MSSPRGAAVIINALYACTLDMTRHLDDADYLIQQVDKRQALADEFEACRSNGGPLYADELEKSKAEASIAEMSRMTPKIIEAIELLRDEAKTHLTSLKTNQRVLRYTNSAISGSGSYMDYKK